MGLRNATIILLLGLTMNGMVGPKDQTLAGLPGSEMRGDQFEALIRQRPAKLTQADKSIETQKEQPAQSEQKNTPTETIEPKPSNRMKEKQPRDFVPSEKIPADQAVDFPTDI